MSDRLLSPAAATLLKAADYIEENGHCKGSYRKTPHAEAMPAVCAYGAILMVTDDGAARTEAANLLKARLPAGVSTPEWNDAPERTQAEVVAMLRGAAFSCRSERRNVMAKSALNVLIEARTLLADEANWDKFPVAKGKFCAAFAIEAAQGYWNARSSALRTLCEANPEIVLGNVGGWNDHPKRTHKQVLAAFDKAIAFSSHKRGET